MYACSLHPHDGEGEKVKHGTEWNYKRNYIEQRYQIAHRVVGGAGHQRQHIDDHSERYTVLDIEPADVGHRHVLYVHRRSTGQQHGIRGDIV